MSSLLSHKTAQFTVNAQSGLPPFMATPAPRGGAAGFSQTLQQRLDQPPSHSTEAAPRREAAPAERSRSAEAPKRSEPPRKQAEAASTESSTAAGTETPPADPQPATPASTAAGRQGETGTNADAQADTGEQAAATAALPAMLAALLPGEGAEPAASEAAEQDPLADLLAGGKQRRPSLLPAGDHAGKSQAAANAGKDAPAAASNDATRVANFVTQLQGRGTAAVTAFTESPARAMQALQGEAPTGLQGIFAPRGPNPLQAATQLQVATPVGQRGWAEDVGSKVIWLTGRGETKAELVITPPNLGKVEVSINMNGDQANAQFLASTREAREALEQALPRLREMLLQAGVNLGQTSVGTSGGHNSGGQEAGRGGRGPGAEGAAEAGDSNAAPRTGWTRQAVGLVDTFA
jgi:flagellar hook-length control protein FliK